MNKFAIRLLASLIFLLLGFAATASANVSVRFCFILDTDYEDYDDGDYWTEGWNHAAYGIRAKVIDNNTDDAVFDGWAGTTGLACTSYLSLNTNHTYLVRLYSKAKDDNDNIVHVFQSYSGENLHQQTVDWEYAPTVGTTKLYTYEIINQEHETNVLAAASFALSEHPAGLSGKNFYLHTQIPPDENGAYMASDGTIFLDQTCKDAKTGTTHELGHLVGLRRNGNQGGYKNYGDTGDDNCTSLATDHRLNSREWQSAAVNEGLAHFYTTVTWNDGTENDCEFRDKDCQGGSDYQVDWLNQCNPPLGSRGNEFDWLRFWWDLHHSASISVQTIFSIWNDANPDTWSGLEYYVYKYLRNAAAANGITNAVWDYWGGINGVDHGIWP
ncbi:MAG: hypothetical protein GX444_17500 [Myxococcales bacterium]|nr:hypothetical protein [Myxococcales bacterium]